MGVEQGQSSGRSRRRMCSRGWRAGGLAGWRTGGLADWRAAHPRATLQEIERTLDERLAVLRARLLEDLALARKHADVQALPAEERPACPACGGRVEARGAKTRRLTTTYERRITLTRSYAVCPACGTGLFPPG